MNAAGHIVALLRGEEENYSSEIEAACSLEIIVGADLPYYIGTTVDPPPVQSLRDILIALS